MVSYIKVGLNEADGVYLNFLKSNYTFILMPITKTKIARLFLLNFHQNGDKGTL